MPLEHRWEALQTPVTSASARETRALKAFAVFLGVVVVATVAAILLISPSKPAEGCIDFVGASTMGASNYRACGDAATHFCSEVGSRDDPQARQMAARCRAAGFE